MEKVKGICGRGFVRLWLMGEWGLKVMGIVWRFWIKKGWVGSMWVWLLLWMM